MERGSCRGKRRDELLIIANQAEKCPHLFLGRGPGPGLYTLHLAHLGLDAASYHGMTQIVRLLKTQTTFGWVGREASSSQGIQHSGQTGEVGLLVGVMYDDVVNVRRGRNDLCGRSTRSMRRWNVAGAPWTPKGRTRY